MKKIACTIAALMLFASTFGCASKSKNIEAAYVSVTPYMELTCEQLYNELEIIQARVYELSARQDKAAAKDAGLVAFAIIVFPVSLFWLDGDDSYELSRLKGEYEAIRKAMARKGCL